MELSKLAQNLLFETEEPAKTIIEDHFKGTPEYQGYLIERLGQRDTKVIIFTTLGEYQIDYSGEISISGPKE